MITAQIITFNNENTIQACINSIENYVDETIICDIGSTDNTLEKCNKHKIIHEKPELGFAEIRNKLSNLSRNNWQFWIEPFEILTEPFSLSDEKCIKIFVTNNHIASKEIRL